MAKKKHIIIVNDDTVFLDLMKELLEEEGWQVTCLRESHKAHYAIREAAPDLVILDVRMGNELTGFELIGLLTLDPTTRSLPLIVCSADSHALQQHEAQMQNQGIGVVHKPFELDDLLVIIRERLEAPSSS